MNRCQNYEIDFLSHTVSRKHIITDNNVDNESISSSQ